MFVVLDVLLVAVLQRIVVVVMVIVVMVVVVRTLHPLGELLLVHVHLLHHIQTVGDVLPLPRLKCPPPTSRSPPL